MGDGRWEMVVIDTINGIIVVCSRQLIPSSNNDERLLHNQMPTIIMKTCNNMQIIEFWMDN